MVRRRARDSIPGVRDHEAAASTPENPSEAKAAQDRPPLVAALSNYLKGVAMGSADLIPGVSGGTVALIVGVYGRLLAALAALSSKEFLRPLSRGRLGEAFRAADVGFLFTLAAGIATAFALLSRVVGNLLANYPGFVLAFFLGLVAASAVVVGRHVERWRPGAFLALVLGAGTGLFIVTLAPVETPGSAPFLFLAGYLAICAMVLPGVSGAFILVLLGKYDLALHGLSHLDLGIILPLGLGAVVGLLSFARLLANLLKRHHDPMVAALTGFIAGSLYKVWPFLDPSGAAAWPWSTGNWQGALLMSALVLAGALVVLGLERLTASERRLLPSSRSSFSSRPGFTPRR